jgi:hypothetical protein
VLIVVVYIIFCTKLLTLSCVILPPTENNNQMNVFDVLVIRKESLIELDIYRKFLVSMDATHL